MRHNDIMHAFSNGACCTHVQDPVTVAEAIVSAAWDELTNLVDWDAS